MSLCRAVLVALAWLVCGASGACYTTTLSITRHTLRVDCRWSNLQHVPSDLKSHDVEELLFEENHLGPFLTVNQFRGFDRLKKLTLDKNYISSVDNDTFYGLSALEHLSLFENTIQALDRDSFKNCPNLKFLNIGGNLFDEIPDYLFQHLPLLEVIKMQDISSSTTVPEVKRLPSGFNSSSHLSNLTMTAFQMYNITADFFDNIRNRSALVHLDFAANEILYVDPHAFDGFDNLANLTLNLNVRMSAEHFNNTLYGLRNSPLIFLACIYCEGLYYINRTTFSWLANSGLRTLWLSASDIKTIDLYAFENLTHLEELHLDNSHMSFYDVELFAGLENTLTYVDFSQNQFLEDITLSIANFTHLTYVDLSVNHQLGVLDPHALDGLHLVETLFLFNCDLKHVDNDSFHDMHVLNFLDLSQNNDLKTLGQLAFHELHAIETLHLDDTAIEELDEDQFVDMPGMVMLTASAMSLRYLPNDLFHNNKLLQEVEFTNNKIEHINETFQHMQNLQLLALDGNAIEAFNNYSFVNCSKIYYLDISRQNNGTSPLIRYIPKTIINHLNKTLISFMIGSNNITVFNPTELHFFENSSLQHIYAENNPYNCSCMLYTGRWFYNFVVWFNHTQKIRPRDHYMYKCKYGKQGKQKDHLMQRFNFKVGILLIPIYHYSKLRNCYFLFSIYKATIYFSLFLDF